MYLVNAVSDDGEVMMLKVPDDNTIASVLTNLLSTTRAINVNVTRMSDENIKRNIYNFIEPPSPNKRRIKKTHNLLIEN